jgi:sacsin
MWPRGELKLPARPQELIQNCDDARARHVAFVLDKRTSFLRGAGSPLLGESLRPFTGPALLQYDDAIFQERDFKSLQSTGDSQKKASAGRVVSDWTC